MPQLTLRKTMETSFRDISWGETKAYKDYERRIRLLGETGRLTINHLREASIDSGRDELNDELAAHIDQELSACEGSGTVPVFWPGCSAVLVGGRGDIIFAYDNPNDNETLTSYGPGLMWALVKAGQERLVTQEIGAVASSKDGYRYLCDQILPAGYEGTSYANRLHIGGFALNSVGARRGHWGMGSMDAATTYAGVSGVLLRDPSDFFRDPVVSEVYKNALLIDSHGGFEGNIGAGANDTLLASRLCIKYSDIMGYNGMEPLLSEDFPIYAKRGMKILYDNGVNVD